MNAREPRPPPWTPSTMAKGALVGTASGAACRLCMWRAALGLPPAVPVSIHSAETRSLGPNRLSSENTDLFYCLSFKHLSVSPKKLFGSVWRRHKLQAGPLLCTCLDASLLGWGRASGRWDVAILRRLWLPVHV